jgi:hypothetical protein
MVPTAFEQNGVWEESIVNSIIRCMQGYPEATFLGKSCEVFKDWFIATKYLWLGCYVFLFYCLKGLSHKIDFKNVDENWQI